VVFVEPEEGTTDEKAPNLIAAIIEDKAIPIRMNSLAGIGVLVEVGSIEKTKPMLIIRKMGGHPVKNHTDASLMEAIDKVHELLWFSISAGGRKVPCRLIPP
jgi:hypothetical protein